jgi:protein-arginine kinase activator protein McsA
LKCAKCQAELPLLHPHIIIERSDEEGNLLCESCWREMERKKED